MLIRVFNLISIASISISVYSLSASSDFVSINKDEVKSGSYIERLQENRSKVMPDVWSYTDSKMDNNINEGLESTSIFKKKKKKEFNKIYIFNIPIDLLASSAFLIPSGMFSYKIKKTYDLYKEASNINKSSDFVLAYEKSNYVRDKKSMIFDKVVNEQSKKFIENREKFHNGFIKNYEDYKEKSVYYNGRLSEQENIKIYQYIKKDSFLDKAFSDSILGGLGYASLAFVAYKLVGKVYKSPLDSISDTVWNTTYLTVGDSTLQDPYAEIEELFAFCMPRLKTYHEELYEKTYQKIIQMRKDDIKFLPQYGEYIKTACSIPLGFDTSPLEVDEYQLYEQFKYYDEGIKTELNDFISQFNQTQFLGVMNQFSYYLEGKPGVGKTYLAKTLAKSLNLPFVTFQLDGASFESLAGKPWNKADRTDKGRLLTALTHPEFQDKDKPYTLNTFMFIDEFDRLIAANDSQSREILGYMLKNLAPDAMSFYSEYLGVTVKFPRISFLAGNSKLEDSALSDRFYSVYFDGYDYETRKSLLINVLLPQALKEKYMDMNSITDEDLAEIEKIVDLEPDNKGLRYIQKQLEKMLVRKMSQYRYF